MTNHTPPRLIISPFSPLRIEAEKTVYEPLLKKEITVTATVLEAVPGKGNDCGVAKEFAAFVVRTVNSHEELLTAAKEVSASFHRFLPVRRKIGPNRAAMEGFIAQLDAAIAKAESL